MRECGDLLIVPVFEAPDQPFELPPVLPVATPPPESFIQRVGVYVLRERVTRRRRVAAGCGCGLPEVEIHRELVYAWRGEP